MFYNLVMVLLNLVVMSNLPVMPQILAILMDLITIDLEVSTVISHHLMFVVPEIHTAIHGDSLSLRSTCK